MTAKEAHDLLMANCSGVKAIKCTEYRTVFAFQMVPDNFKSNDDPDKLIDFMRSVNKFTGEVRDFKPFHISLNEYRNGIPVDEFE